MEIIVFLSLAVMGYIAGSIAESRHYRSIEERETLHMSLPVSTMRRALKGDVSINESRLVMGNAVISVDYFKRILASLRNIFGGEVGAYSSLVDRARREAILRMVEQAGKADIIINLRIETSVIGAAANNRNNVGSVEALAFGTAVYYSRQDETHQG